MTYPWAKAKRSSLQATWWTKESGLFGGSSGFVTSSEKTMDEYIKIVTRETDNDLNDFMAIICLLIGYHDKHHLWLFRRNSKSISQKFFTDVLTLILKGAQLQKSRQIKDKHSKKFQISLFFPPIHLSFTTFFCFLFSDSIFFSNFVETALS